jgi:phosphoribosylformimino-5-aminoimidazole carboxamide ribotide isomerase
MIVIPAVDLREGACVQLEGGEYDRERVRMPNPILVARSWTELGFRALHVVDLDAATGRGSNEDLVRELIREAEVPVQVGGGVRSSERIDLLLTDGAERVVVGTRALEEPEWLAHVASLFPLQLVVAADVRDRRIVTRGWMRTLEEHIDDAIDQLNDLPLAGVLVTAVHREGQLAGTDHALMEDVAERSIHPVQASGGITTLQDLRRLEEAGVAGAIVGMALYTGALDARVVAEEFGE